MRVVIVGAGIAGPALGAFLARAGIESIICEARAAPAGTEGGFLGVAPNGMRVLAALGLDARVEARGVPCDGFSFLNAAGKPLGRIERRFDAENLGARLVMIERAALHRVLLDHAAERGVPIRHRAGLVALDTADPTRVVARFDDGSEELADLVVGCDGLRSRVRSLTFPELPEPAYGGLLDFGGYARVDDAPLPEAWNVMVFGRRAFFGAFRAPPDAGGRSEVWWFHNGGAAEPLRELAPEARRRRILDAHAGDPPWIRACVEATPEILGPWPFHEVAPLRRWHRGRAGVIGDAAHATSPSAGQGASLALEDAMLLARCLRDAGDPQAAFARLVELRRDRVAEVARHARRNSSRKAPGPVGAWIRDRVMPLVIPSAAAAQDRHYAYRIEWNEAS